MTTGVCHHTILNSVKAPYSLIQRCEISPHILILMLSTLKDDTKYVAPFSVTAYNDEKHFIMYFQCVYCDLVLSYTHHGKHTLSAESTVFEWAGGRISKSVFGSP